MLTNGLRGSYLLKYDRCHKFYEVPNDTITPSCKMALIKNPITMGWIKRNNNEHFCESCYILDEKGNVSVKSLYPE